MLPRADERRFTEEELALILNRAAELQDGVAREGGQRYTLAEIQEIAEGAGISSSHVAAAAARVRQLRSEPDGVLGAPWRFRFEETIDGEVDDEVIGELLDLARQELGIQGRVTEALGAVEWLARDSFGSTHVMTTRRGGRTTIVVLSSRTDAAAVAGIGGAVSALLGSIALGIVIAGTAGLGAPLAGLAGGLAGTGGSWYSMRAMWRSYARRKNGDIIRLGEALVDSARRAIALGRVTKEEKP